MIRQDHNWTVLTNRDTITLFWPDYLDKPGIVTNFYKQWSYSGRRAIELPYLPPPNNILEQTQIQKQK
jgi:hypothetical protein